MKIVQLQGGLGNQLYQWAFGYALAKSTGDEVLYDDSWFAHNNKTKKCTLRNYELNLFISDIKLATKKQVKFVKHKPICPRFLRKFFHIDSDRNIIFDKDLGKFNQDLLQDYGTKYYSGYWVNEKYFEKYIKDLQKLFKLNITMDKTNQDWLKLIKKTNSVSVHIRRGDYVTSGFRLCSLDYYKKSFAKMAKQTKSPVFFVFSDDPKWAKENIKTKYPIYFIDNNDGEHGYFDFELMRNCKHNITANSTFSIWASILNTNKNKIVIMPENKGIL